MQEENIYDKAHKHSIFHRKEIERSDLCGCFYCMHVFKPTEITQWIDDEGGVGQTALCPSCGIDSVIGNKAGYKIDKEFLRNMFDRWFGGDEQ